MRNKRGWVIGLIQGVLLLATAVIIPLYKTENTNIIGGAGWPTFCFYFRQYLWLLNAGIAITVLSAAVLWFRSRQK